MRALSAFILILVCAGFVGEASATLKKKTKSIPKPAAAQSSVIPQLAPPSPTTPTPLLVGPSSFDVTYQQKVDCGLMSKTLQGMVQKPGLTTKVYLDQLTLSTAPGSSVTVKRDCYLVKE